MSSHASRITVVVVQIKSNIIDGSHEELAAMDLMTVTKMMKLQSRLMKIVVMRGHLAGFTMRNQLEMN